jgi:hypothetical protein
MVDENTEKIRPATPPLINWYATSLNTSPSSDSEASPPYETISSAISKLQVMLDEKISQGLGTFSKHFDKGKACHSLQDACNEAEQNLADILNTQTYRNIEKEFDDCDRLYRLNKFMPL